MSRGREIEKNFIERLRRYGASQLERELGWYQNHFYKMTSRRTGLRLVEIVEVLDHLRDSLASLDPGRLPPSATMRFLGQGEKLAFRRKDLLPPPSRKAMPDRVTDEELRLLDDLRVEDPQATAKLAGSRAFEAAREGRMRDAALLLARKAAALRLRMDYHGAHVCLWWALRRLPDEPDLWLRASTVVGDYAVYSDALELAGLALNTFFRQGDFVGSARCLLNQGRYYLYLTRYAEAHQAFATSLTLLPAELKIHRVAALQCQGLAFFNEGNAEEAARSLAEAVEIGIPPGIFGGQLLWLQARIAAGRERPTEALELYRETVGRLEASPEKAVLATCEMVRLLLQEGQWEEATQRARETLRFIQTSESPVVGEALRELGGAALAGAEKLTVPFLDRLLQKMQRGFEKARQQAAAGLLVARSF